MKKTYNTTIGEFLAPKRFALAGVSRNEKKFGFIAFKELRDKGYEMFPIHPEADEINGMRCYHSITEVPSDVKHLISMVPKDQTKGVVEQALEHGISNIWIQQMSETQDAIDLALQKNAGLVIKSCILMYASPVKGVHRFHRVVMKLFGRLPN
jgi:uncharacterized protein